MSVSTLRATARPRATAAMRLVEWACEVEPKPAAQRILAIDPGTRVMGYAILQGDGRQLLQKGLAKPPAPVGGL